MNIFIIKEILYHCLVYFILFCFFYLEIENCSKEKNKTNKFVSHKCITKFPRSFALENHTITSVYGLSVKHFLTIYWSPPNFKPLFAIFRYILRVQPYVIAVKIKLPELATAKIYHSNNILSNKSL